MFRAIMVRLVTDRHSAVRGSIPAAFAHRAVPPAVIFIATGPIIRASRSGNRFHSRRALPARRLPGEVPNDFFLKHLTLESLEQPYTHPIPIIAMTYCLSINVERGLVFCSDSRTNAGMDNLGSYSKLHTFVWPGDRVFVLLSAGNLATTQAVVKKMYRDVEQALVPNLVTAASMSEAADYVGMISTHLQRLQASRDTAHTNFEATFIFGGQLANQPPETFMIYPQGNYIHESGEHPFLQIGETKYGKPILDRIVKRGVSLERAARCAFVSMNSTIRSNVTVGPPVELLIYERDSLTDGRRLYLTDDDPFAREVSEKWNEGLIRALENLPHFPWENAESEAT
jgi:putative proteasome-type protease